MPALGKNNIDRPVIIFRGLRIPTYFVFDADCAQRGKGGHRAALGRNRRYMVLTGVAPEDFPSTRVENEWAVFEDRIETTIRAEIGNDLFSEACGVAAAATSFDAESGVLKNYDGAISFLDHVYSKGRHIAPLEDIIKKVENLAR